MKMIEAFKRLLDGERITRSDWAEDKYIRYSKEMNSFLLCIPHLDKFHKLDKVVFNDNASISFETLPSNGTTILILWDDNYNEIYVSEEEKMELDAMKWRLYSYCFSFGTCGGCRLKNECNAQNTLNNNELDNLSPEKVKRLYDLISEEK